MACVDHPVKLNSFGVERPIPGVQRIFGLGAG